jgi:hypothetical protein
MSEFSTEKELAKGSMLCDEIIVLSSLNLERWTLKKLKMMNEE